MKIIEAIKRLFRKKKESKLNIDEVLKAYLKRLEERGIDWQSKNVLYNKITNKDE